MIEDKNCIGSRIVCEGHKGTVKYVGAVGDTKGQWLGVDWDDPGRGKHNGTYEGVKYYETWHPTSGSFIRPSKATYGISCPDAIKIRYGYVDDELAGIDRAAVASLQKSLNAPFLEMVGFAKVNKKQSEFDQLEIVCLNEQRVSSAGREGELVEMCPRVERLDLSHNLVNSWRIVAEICRQLSSLQQLDVSGNQLPIDDQMESLVDAFANLRHLTMGKMRYDWPAVMRCLAMTPCLRELTVSFNNIESITTVEGAVCTAKLTDLSLENNLICSWDEVLKLGELPSLRSLNLSSNKLEVIRFPSDDAGGKTKLFPSLKQLHVSNNNIKDWRSVSELEKLRGLEELRFRENPVLKEQSSQTAMQLIIAKIATLRYLNGHEIEASERRGAEYDYLKLFSAAWKASEQDILKRREFVEDHPRFPALIEKYGVLDTSESIKSTQLSSNVITVEFVCPDEPSVQTIKKKLLKNMDVQKLVGITQRLFRINSKLPKLSFVRPNVSEDEIPLDKPLQELSYYLIDDGDLILVRW